MSKKSRMKRERRKVSARKVAENKKSGFASTLYKIPEGVRLFSFKQNECIKRFDILDYVTGSINPNAEEPGMEHYELSFLIHRGLGADTRGTYVCPRSAKRKCPICDYRTQLIKDGTPWDDEVVKGLKAKERQLFLLYDLDDMEAGLQVLDMSYHLFGKMLNDRIKASDEDDGYEYFSSHGMDGKTLKVAFDEKSFGSNKYPEASSIDFKPRKKAYPDDLIENMPCLDDMLIIKSYEELNRILLEGEEDQDATAQKEDVDDEDIEDSIDEEGFDDLEDNDDDDLAEAKQTVKKPAKVASNGKTKAAEIVDDVDDDDEEEDDDDDGDEDDEWTNYDE